MNKVIVRHKTDSKRCKESFRRERIAQDDGVSISRFIESCTSPDAGKALYGIEVGNVTVCLTHESAKHAWKLLTELLEKHHDIPH